MTVLERLADSAHRPLLVLTRPDRPRGRGRRPAPTPVAVAARALGIEVLAPEHLNDAADRVAGLGPSAVVVCAYGALLREPFLSAHEILNVHPSILPRWRGAAPIERAMMAGDERAGVSIIRLTAGLDSGPVCAKASVTIAPQDTYGTLAPRLASLGAEILLASLGGSREFVEQPEEGVTYAEKITPADRDLDPTRGPSELERVVRALHPHIGARIGELRVLGARVPAPPPTGPAGGEPTAEAAGEAAGVIRPAPGELLGAGGRLLYGAAGGALELLRVQPPGGRPMEAADYLRGHAV